MDLIYNIGIWLFKSLAPVISVFSPKLKLAVRGRKNIWKKIAAGVKEKDNWIWFHVASLGEFEQGLPVMQAIRQNFPDYKLCVTFFSPSGYEVRKDHPVAHLCCYLPWDTRFQANRFVEILRPRMAVFVKYEFWPNYLNALKQNHVITIVISAYFRKDQIFFRWYGHWMRQKLSAFHHFFLQDQSSADLLSKIGYDNYSIVGDTRFDRVLATVENFEPLDFAESFCNGKPCLVLGSTWPEDEVVWLDWIHTHSASVKLIIVPHDIHSEHLEKLVQKIGSNAKMLSQISNLEELKDLDILIIDRVGLLSRLYNYAQVAYVGGGFSSGKVHNVLEPAAFGKPILIGPRHQGYLEIEELKTLDGIIIINTQMELKASLHYLFENPQEAERLALISKTYVKSKAGCTSQIISWIIQALNNRN